MTGPLTSVEVISERVKQMAEYVYNRLGPKVTNVAERVSHAQDYEALLDMRVQDVRDDVTKLNSVVFGNGSEGLKTEVASLQDAIEYTKVDYLNKLQIIEQRLEGRIKDLQEWRVSLDRKVWAVLLILIGLLIETLYSTITGTP